MFNNQLVSTLNTFEFKVYNYVIKNHQTVIYMTVRELAEACDVSTATILRFCKKMNCSGYAEFKAYLKMNAEKRGEISLPHGANEFLSFFKSINNDEFDALIASAAEQIAGAERVIFVGAGSSGTLGRYGARFFSNIGKFSNHIDDPYYPVNTDADKALYAQYEAKAKAEPNTVFGSYLLVLDFRYLGVRLVTNLTLKTYFWALSTRLWRYLPAIR